MMHRRRRRLSWAAEWVKCVLWRHRLNMKECGSHFLCPKEAWQNCAARLGAPGSHTGVLLVLMSERAYASCLASDQIEGGGGAGGGGCQGDAWRVSILQRREDGRQGRGGGAGRWARAGKFQHNIPGRPFRKPTSWVEENHEVVAFFNACRRSTMVKALLLLLVFLLCTLLQAAAENSLELNSSLSPLSPPFNSSSSAFMFSFRSPSSSSTSTSTSTSTNLYLAISFAVSPDGPPVWVANRDSSVSTSAVLTLSSSGDLRLSDTSVSSSIIWSSGTSDLGVVRAHLLDTGNLVLLNSSGGYVWQSFQNPTDTLLPGQIFSAESKQLVSGNGPQDFSSGRYSLGFDTLTGVLQLNYTNDSEVYWDTWGNISLFLFDHFGNISLYNSPSSFSSSLISNDYGSSATRRLTLDVDGNLRMYSWDQASALWDSVWLAFTDVCSRVPGLCGNYGVCIYEPQPTCMCPLGFSVVDPSDLSKGCSPNYQIPNCSTSTKYVEIEDTDFPNNDYRNFTFVSEEECKQNCSRYCPCLIAVYWQSGDGHCWLKKTALNGRIPGSQQHRVFLKISDSDPLVSSPVVDTATKWSTQTLWQTPSSSNQSINSTSTSTGTKLAVVIALTVVIATQFLCYVATFSVLIGKYRRKLRYIRLSGDLEGVSGSPVVCSYQELESATENFSHKLGAGGFGTVYKGQFQNGRVVAVKQLEGVSQQEKQFRAEISTIGRIHHINLLRLLGFCAEGSHRLLVYEYMENGSLDQILFCKAHEDDDSSQIKALDWGKRFQICLGVARGITYLHEECLDRILHCDIKPQNILLDSRYCAKVADFGLAYLYSRDHTVKMTTIRGTRGYLAPEWVSNLPITAKADVYSYGMLIMEIVSGKSNYLYTESAMMEANDKWCFPMWAYGKGAKDVADARMEEASVDWNQVDAVLKVAFACIQADMHARPPMAKVVQMLEGTLPIPEAPPPSLFSQDTPSSSSSSKVPTTT